MAVVQTQIILAMVGSVVMIVVGTSLARAFGIVGAAGLVRYRAKIADPKDAGVMLSTLAIGLAAIFSMITLSAGPWLYGAMAGTAANVPVLAAAIAYSNVVFGGALAIWLVSALAAVRYLDRASDACER